jgi:hypothetical protein
MSEYNCTNCSKVYKYRQSLHKHKKKCIQVNNELNSTTNNTVNLDNNISNNNQQTQVVKETYKCIYCNKEYKYKSSKYKHQKLCSKKTEDNELNAETETNTEEEQRTYTRAEVEFKLNEVRAEMMEMLRMIELLNILEILNSKNNE